LIRSIRFSRCLAVLGIVCLGGIAICDEIPAPGSKAPEIELVAVSNGGKKETVRISDYKDKKNVVLAFYPKAMTKGCTIECNALSKVNEKFAKLDTVVFGISTDDETSQDKFIAKESLQIPLLADPDKKITTKLGALSARGFANRYTYVIDKKGNIAKVYTKVAPATHAEEVLTYIEKELSK
jgi:peroxiredoxin Q/BCP